MGKAVGAARHDLIEAKGSPHERGVRVGGHYRRTLLNLLKENYRYYVEVAGTSREDVLSRAARFRKATEDFSPLLGEEVRGIAEGAGVKVDEVYVLAAFNELYYPSVRRGCTSFAVRDGATADGLTYVGQNNDDAVEPWLRGDCVTLVRYVQNEGPNVLAYSYAGIPAQMGINSSGLALCANALHYDRVATGVPMFCLVREVLNQKSVDDAIELISAARRPYALNFVLGDARGIADVETTPKKIEVTRSDRMLYHTNHYLCMKDAEIGKQTGKRFHNTKVRCARIAELLGSGEGKLDLELLEAYLRDHKNRPDSVCRHAGESPGYGGIYKTFDSMIYIPEKREGWLTRGNPCETEYVRYAA